jgi:hypothetical protein
MEDLILLESDSLKEKPRSDEYRLSIIGTFIGSAQLCLIHSSLCF